VPYLTCPNCHVTNYVVPSYLARRERCVTCDRQLDERAAAILPPLAAIACHADLTGENSDRDHGRLGDILEVGEEIMASATQPFG